MLRTVLCLMAATLLCATASAEAIPGKSAPAFTATDALSGKPVALADFKGKAVVLEWTNPGCPFVKKFYSAGKMQQLQADAATSGVVWVSVNSSAEGKEGFLKDSSAVKEWMTSMKSHAKHYVLDHDGTIGRTYGAKTTPHMYVIDKTGMLVYRGAIDSKDTADAADIATATNYVSQALEAVAAGAAMKPAQTKPYGCAVKY